MSWKTAALVGTFTIALAGTPLAVERIPRPVVPTDIEVSADYKLFLVGHAEGTQNYICAPAYPRVTTGSSSARRLRCSMPTGDRSSLTT